MSHTRGVCNDRRKAPSAVNVYRMTRCDTLRNTRLNMLFNSSLSDYS